MEIRIIIDDGFWRGACAKRYKSDPEEIEQIEREKRIQRERDERAQRQSMNTPADGEGQPAV